MASRRHSRSGAVAILVLCGLIALMETHHQIPGFRAFTFGFVFLIVAIFTALAGGRTRDGLLVLSTLALGLCGLEAAAVFLQPKGGLEITPFWLSITPEVGFAFDRAGVVHSVRREPGTGTLVFDARYTIGDTFDRKVESASGGPATVFFGDSFTFGEGLNDADTLPQRFADIYDGKRRVLNLAITGYSPQQFLREVETRLRDAVIGPKPSAFVFLTSPFHAMRTACKESWTNWAPRYASVEGRPIYQGRCFQGVRLGLHEFLQNSALYRLAIQPYLNRLTHADVDLYIKILAEAVRLSKDKYGVATLVPFVRSPPGYLAGTGYDDDAVIAALKARGVWLLDMTLPAEPSHPFLYNIKGDGHPTAAANIVRARMIADALEQGEAPKAGATPF